MKTKQTQDNWKEVELGEIFEFKEKTGIKAGEGLETGKYKFFTSSDTQSKFIDKFSFKGEHLIFSTGGKAGIHYCNENFSVSNDCFTVKVKDHLTKFIYYLLKSKLYLLEKGFKGAGLKHLSKEYLKKIEVRLPFLQDGKPDLKEQERIISILEKAEETKEKSENAESLLGEYLKSIFNEMFGNPLKNEKKFGIKSISELTSFVSYGFTRPMPHLKKGIPIITSKNVMTGSIDFLNVDYTDEKSFNELSNKDKPIKGDILYTKDGRIGEAALVEDDREFCISQAVAVLRPNKEEINPTFFERLLNSNNFKKLIERQAYGVALKHISITKLKREKIISPPIPLQQKFVKIVEHVEGLKENVRKTQQKSEELFNSLMGNAFEGKL
ncbi:restriction endonuclease subunit S [Candidatus Woesearchaeota archaeon]|nr:restriction endonuclease subunit S [Candidatus Woesearchaeota archaeon]